jgi:hypothetical protein
VYYFELEQENAMLDNLTRRESLQSLAGMAALWTPAANSLAVRAFNAEGQPAGEAQLKSLLLIDAEGRPFEHLPQVTGPGTATIGVPAVEFQVMMMLPVLI